MQSRVNNIDKVYVGGTWNLEKAISTFFVLFGELLFVCIFGINSSSREICPKFGHPAESSEIYRLSRNLFLHGKNYLEEIVKKNVSFEIALALEW